MDSLFLRDMFVPMLGLVTAIIATIAAVLTAIFGPFKKLRLPVESVPGTSRGFLNVVLFAPFVTSFLLIDPARAQLALLLSLAALVAAFVCYQKYGSNLNVHRYTKPRARRFLWFQWNRDETVIGGTELTKLAKERKRNDGTPEQTLLAEAEYDAGEIWTKESRAAAQSRIERWYYGFMLFALLTVVLAALAFQTLVSNEAPLVTAQRVWTKVTAQSK